MIDIALFLCIVAMFGLLATIARAVARVPYEPAPRSDHVMQLKAEALRQSAWVRGTEPLVRVLAGQIERLPLHGHMAWLSRKLTYAGHPLGYSPAEWSAAGVVKSVAVYVIVVLVSILLGHPSFFWPLVPAVAVYGSLCMGLREDVRRRRFRTTVDLPYFLDLVSLTMAAGATFRVACESIVKGPVRGPVEENVLVMLSETEAGSTHEAAIENMLSRSDCPDLEKMVAAVRQGHSLGTPLVDILRDEAQLGRFRRVERGERLAAKLPVRLTLPAVVLMFACMLLLLGPVILKAQVKGIGL